MATFLAQNEFISGSASVPFAKSEAAAACPQPRAAVTLSDGAGAKPVQASSPSEAVSGLGRAETAALTHNAVTQAVEVRTSLEDELTHLLGVAGKRRRRPLNLPRFAPDFPALWHAMHDKNAPRTVLDPLWADAAPLFLRGA